jgi:hypothetical protein
LKKGLYINCPGITLGAVDVNKKTYSGELCPKEHLDVY